MCKKSIAVLIAAIICCSVIFTACNKDKYTDPSTGGEFILVTDENGNKVLSEDGELLVYATDENGKKIKDDEGNFVTEVHGFIGQLENNGVVEDYAYYFTLPSGWKTVSDRGEFINKSKGYDLTISIEEKTFNDYLREAKIVFNNFTSSIEKGTTEQPTEIYWDEYDYDNIDTKAYMITFKSGDFSAVTMFFSQNNNMYVLNFEHTGDIDFEDAKAEMLKIFNALEFKPYVYYEGLTDAPVKEEK